VQVIHLEKGCFVHPVFFTYFRESIAVFDPVGFIVGTDDRVESGKILFGQGGGSGGDVDRV